MKRFARSTGNPTRIRSPVERSYGGRAFCREFQESFAHKYFGVPFNLLPKYDTPRLATIGAGRPEDEFLARALSVHARRAFHFITAMKSVSAAAAIRINAAFPVGKLQRRRGTSAVFLLKSSSGFF